MNKDFTTAPEQEFQSQHIYVKSPAMHKLEQQDLMIATEAVTRLGQWYPGHAWKVSINSDRLGGVALVYHMDISHAVNLPMPFVVHLKNVYDDPNYLWAMRAGGELLERAGVARGHHHEGDVVERIDGMEEKYQPIRGILI